MKRLITVLAILLTPHIALAQVETRCVSVTPTIDTAAYADGDNMSATAQTFTGLLNPSRSRTGRLVSATIADDADQAVDLELYVYSTLPSSYGADNAAFDPSDSALDTILGKIFFDFSDENQGANLNDNALIHRSGLSIPVRSVVATPANLYTTLRARGAYDGDADSITITLCVEQD